MLSKAFKKGNDFSSSEGDSKEICVVRDIFFSQNSSSLNQWVQFLNGISLILVEGICNHIRRNKNAQG